MCQHEEKLLVLLIRPHDRKQTEGDSVIEFNCGQARHLSSASSVP